MTRSACDHTGLAISRSSPCHTLAPPSAADKTTIDLRSLYVEPAMLQTVQCAHCGRKLAIDPKHVGTSVVCPLCKQSFTPAAEPEALPVAQPEHETAGIQRDEPRLRQARPAEPSASPRRHFAARCGIDV